MARRPRGCGAGETPPAMAPAKKQRWIPSSWHPYAMAELHAARLGSPAPTPPPPPRFNMNPDKNADLASPPAQWRSTCIRDTDLSLPAQNNGFFNDYYPYTSFNYFSSSSSSSLPTHRSSTSYYCSSYNYNDVYNNYNYSRNGFCWDGGEEGRAYGRSLMMQRWRGSRMGGGGGRETWRGDAEAMEAVEGGGEGEEEMAEEERWKRRKKRRKRKKRREEEDGSDRHSHGDGGMSPSERYFCEICRNGGIAAAAPPPPPAAGHFP